MRRVLLLLFSTIFLSMLVVSIQASLKMPIFDAWPTYSANPWAIATLWDAYCGFVIFYVWVAWREQSWVARGLWFVLVMGLGNMATSGYLLWRVWQLQPGEGVRSLLLGEKLAV